MAKPFPTFTLSRGPQRSPWTEKAMADPTIRSPFASGAALSRGRYTTAPPKLISYTYGFMTSADKILFEDHEDHANVGGAKFSWRHPDTDEDWEMRYHSPIVISAEPRQPGTWRVNVELYGKEVKKMRQMQIPVEDLGAGVDITNRPVFVSPEAVTISSIGILTQGSPAGVDDGNTAVLLVEDDASNALVTKTYNAGTQPPSSDYADLGNVGNASLAAGEHLMLTVTQGATANLPAFILVIEYFYTS